MIADSGQTFTILGWVDMSGLVPIVESYGLNRMLECQSTNNSLKGWNICPFSFAKNSGKTWAKVSWVTAT